MCTYDGLKIDVPWQVRHAFKDIFLYHTYFHPGVLATLPEKPVVIDIGGNVGFFSSFALCLRPQARCLSFEPLVGNYSQLQDNRKLNPEADWHPVHGAVAGWDGSVRICSPSGDSLVTNAFIETTGRDRPEQSSGEIVAAWSLETVFKQHQIEHCDWLKIDCEGAEYDIVYSMPTWLFKRITAIMIETHVVPGDRNTSAALCDYLENQGFDLWLADDDVIYGLRRK